MSAGEGKKTMKRRRDESPSRDTSTKRTKKVAALDDLLHAVESLSRSDLKTVINVACERYNQMCAEVTLNVPREVWEHIWVYCKLREVSSVRVF